jgi:hypothetical protein
MPLESLKVTVMSNATLLGKRFGDSGGPLVLTDQPGSVGMWNALMVLPSLFMALFPCLCFLWTFFVNLGKLSSQL